MPIHHNFKKGQKIIIRLRNGEVIEDRYEDTKGNYIMTTNHKIKWKDISFSSILKNRNVK